MNATHLSRRSCASLESSIAGRLGEHLDRSERPARPLDAYGFDRASSPR